LARAPVSLSFYPPPRQEEEEEENKEEEDGKEGGKEERREEGRRRRRRPGRFEEFWAQSREAALTYVSMEKASPSLPLPPSFPPSLVPPLSSLRSDTMSYCPFFRAPGSHSLNHPSLPPSLPLSPQVEHHIYPSFHVLGYPANFGPELRHVGPTYGFLVPLLPPSRPPSTPTLSAKEEEEGGKEEEIEEGKGFGTGSYGQACEEFTEEEKKGMEGNVVVVERGGCSFVSKVRRVQAAGGVGVVVLDLRSVPPSSSFPPSSSPSMSTEGKEEEGGGEGGGGGGGGGGGTETDSIFSTWQVMHDDQTGSDIVIPSTLLGGEGAWSILLTGYLPISPSLLPFLPEVQGGGGREGGKVLVRMGAEDMLALEEETELLDLTALIGPALEGREGGREGGGGGKKANDLLASLMKGMKDILLPRQQRGRGLPLKGGGGREEEEEEEDVEEDYDDDDDDDDDDDNDNDDDEEEEEEEWLEALEEEDMEAEEEEEEEDDEEEWLEAHDEEETRKLLQATADGYHT